jgi:hypothetical protein
MLKIADVTDNYVTLSLKLVVTMLDFQILF